MADYGIVAQKHNYQEKLIKILKELEPGKEFNRIPLEFGFQFVSDSFGIFEYRDYLSDRYFFTEKDEIALIYVGKNTRKK
ncbi:MAG: hypothetical protein AABX93_03770 [Nanoarchaeota archaeon]